MKNIEIKCPVIRFDAVRRALNASGAVRQTPVLKQVDWYFSVPHGRLKLRQTDGGPGELLFYVRPSRRGRRLSVYGRSPVPDVPGLRSLLTKSLGQSACIRKSREVWLFRNARIHLDRVSRLGAFVEIEVEVRRGPRQARALMDALISTLRLSPAASIGGSYADLSGHKLGNPRSHRATASVNTGSPRATRRSSSGPPSCDGDSAWRT